jgi:predicted nucleic acid-binding Zn ribbon protein
MEAVKKTVKSVMGEWDKRRKSALSDEPWGLLKKALTKKELMHIKFNYFRGGILALNVDSSAWLYKLNLKKETFLAVLNKKSNNLKDIRLYLGEIK